MSTRTFSTFMSRHHSPTRHRWMINDYGGELKRIMNGDDMGPQKQHYVYKITRSYVTHIVHNISNVHLAPAPK